MNVDQVALVFVVEYYEMLANKPKMLDSVYAEGSRLVIYQGDSQQQQYITNYGRFVPTGPRKIIWCSGSLIEDQLFVQVRSTKIIDEEDVEIDESFVCAVSDLSILIQYHSIHIGKFNKFLPKPKVVVHQKPASQKPSGPPKPVVTATEVDDFDKLVFAKSLVIKGLSFYFPPSEFLLAVEAHGHIVKYVQARGTLIVELDSVDSVFNVIKKCPKRFDDRNLTIFRLTENFSWNRPK